MGFKAVEWAFEQQLKSSDKLLLVALAKCRNDNDGYCCPGYDLLVSMTGMRRETISKSFRSLESKNLIKRTRRFSSSTTYELAISTEFRTSTENRISTEKRTSTKNRTAISTENRTAISTKNGTLKVNEKEYKSKHIRKASVTKPDGVSQEDWDEWNSLRNKKHLFLTTRALKSIEAEAVKAGKTLPEVISICLEHSWAGFKAEWLKNQSNNKQQPASVFDQFVVTNGYLKSKIEESKKEEADAQSLFGSFL